MVSNKANLEDLYRVHQNKTNKHDSELILKALDILH